MDKLPDFERIVIPGVKDYYAGDNGEIYKAKEKGEIILHRLLPQFPDEKYKIKYVNIKVYSRTEGLSNKLFAVHFLVKVAFDGFFPYGFKVIYKDKNYNNTAYKNLEWIYDPKNIWRNEYIFI